jgi:hypothetical protein
MAESRAVMLRKGVVFRCMTFSDSQLRTYNEMLAHKWSYPNQIHIHIHLSLLYQSIHVLGTIRNSPSQSQNLEFLWLARYAVKPTYAPVTTSPKIMNLRKNHVQLPPSFAPFIAVKVSYFLPPLVPLLPLLPPGPCGMYRFFVQTLMMSWLSLSSPVSALKPR